LILFDKGNQVLKIKEMNVPSFCHIFMKIFNGINFFNHNFLMRSRIH